MLTSLAIHNVKTYLNAKIDFGCRHLVIGPNNSGKTNLAAAIRFLGATSAVDLNTAALWIPGGIPDMRNRDLRSDILQLSCTCSLEYDGEPCDFTYELTLKVKEVTAPVAAGHTDLAVESEQLTLNASRFDDVALLKSDGREAVTLREDRYLKGDSEAYTEKSSAPKGATMLSKLYALDTNRRAIHFRWFLSRWNYYALSPHAIRAEWGQVTQSPMTFGPRGAGLASAIFQLKNIDEMRYRALLEHTRRVMEPDLEVINFLTTPDQAAVPFVVLRSQPRSSWAALSDGTLRFLALAYIILTTDPSPDLPLPTPTLSIIEEPENGIYPGQLRRLFELFEEYAPRGQFIFTSHSPYFIDFFDAKRDCVTVLRRDKERTEIRVAPQLTAKDRDPDRLTLAERYAAELLE